MRMLCVTFFVALIAFTSCADKEKMELLSQENVNLKSENETLRGDLKKLQTHYNKMKFLAKSMTGVTATIITTHGNIDLKFYPDLAPLHCFNFLARAESGFYDNTKFHRVMPGFMIQGGDPNTRSSRVATYGMGGPLINIPHEFSPTEHKRGILSTARPPDKSVGAGSQFFIMHADYPSLNNEYTVFGEVTAGMDVVDKIATTRTVPPNRPADPVVIRTIEIARAAK